jgi:hypothetical protein
MAAVPQGLCQVARIRNRRVTRYGWQATFVRRTGEGVSLPFEQRLPEWTCVDG